MFEKLTHLLFGSDSNTFFKVIASAVSLLSIFSVVFWVYASHIPVGIRTFIDQTSVSSALFRLTGIAVISLLIAKAGISVLQYIYISIRAEMVSPLIMLPLQGLIGIELAETIIMRRIQLYAYRLKKWAVSKSFLCQILLFMAIFSYLCLGAAGALSFLVLSALSAGLIFGGVHLMEFPRLSDTPANVRLLRDRIASSYKKASAHRKYRAMLTSTVLSATASSVIFASIFAEATMRHQVKIFANGVSEPISASIFMRTSEGVIIAEHVNPCYFACGSVSGAAFIPYSDINIVAE